MGVGQRYAVIQLKTKYNAAFLKSEFDKWEQRIDDMYALHYPRMFIDPYTMQLSYESKPHRRFGIKYYRRTWEARKFKHKSNHDLKKFNIILSNYSESEQRQIKRYQRDDVLADESLILRICEDISHIDSKDKNNRNTAIQEEIKADKERRRAEGKARKERIKGVWNEQDKKSF